MSKKKIISAFILSIALISSTIMTSPATVSAASSRIGGTDRYETSVKISQDGWADGSDYVVLASGEGYADALCAAPIAKKYNAPILLTSSKTLNSTIKSEIIRLKAKNVIEIGGQASISLNIEKQLKNDMSLNVVRLGGTDRYETSANVARELGDISDVVVTSGLSYADALSIAPIAASKGYPILLTPKNSVTNSVKSYIDSHKSDSTKVYVIGGTGVIPDSALSSIPKYNRISGKDRYETNVSVINAFKSDLKLSSVYIARGEGTNEFADALSASALSAKTSSPVILTSNVLNSSTQKFIKSNLNKDTNVVSIGGQATVSDSIVNTIQNIINGTDESKTPSTSGDNGDSSDGSSDSDSGSGSNSGGSSSQLDHSNVKSILEKLNKINTAGLDDAQKKVINDSISCMDKYINDTNYDYTDDVDSIENLYKNLSPLEKSRLVIAGMSAGIDNSDISSLEDEFGISL